MLRHYDEIEGDRSYKTGDRQVLLVMDEGDPAIVEALRATRLETPRMIPNMVSADRAL